MVLKAGRLRWRKSECQLQKTKEIFLRRKEKGTVDLIASMMFFLILVLAIFFGFRVTQYMVTAAGVEDALAASNLASAVIDIEEYGKSHRIQIKDTDRAFAIYREALCVNLKTDAYLNTTNQDFLAGQVEIIEYIIYNVRDEQIYIQKRNGNGEVVEEYQANKGTVYTPDGVCVEETTIYSRIGFWVEGLMEQMIYARKDKSVDIVRCEIE